MWKCRWKKSPQALGCEQRTRNNKKLLAERFVEKRYIVKAWVQQTLAVTDKKRRFFFEAVSLIITYGLEISKIQQITIKWTTEINIHLIKFLTSILAKIFKNLKLSTHYYRNEARRKGIMRNPNYSQAKRRLL